MTQHNTNASSTEVTPSTLDGGETFLVPAETLASFPIGTVLENIAISASGDIFMTSFLNGTIIRRTPDGMQEVFAHIDDTMQGIVIAPDGGLFVCGRAEHAPESIYHIRARGQVEKWLDLPADARFLNGMTRLSDQV